MKDTVFSPAFGNRPNQLVGRSKITNDILEGLESEPGSKERATLLLGQRGFGKTVLLWEIADLARERGFVVASPTVVSDNMPERIIEKIQDDGERFMKDKRGRLVGGTVGALGFTVGLQFSDAVQETKSFGYKLAKLSERLEEQDRGILVLVDEVQASSPELKQLVTSYLELVGERRNVALVLAGLPGAVSAVLNERVLTFLNRAHKIQLGPLAIGDVDAFFAQAFPKAGVMLDREMRREAALHTEGSPYMLQLVGHYIVEYADDNGHISNGGFSDALSTAASSFKEDVCSTTVAALSDKDVDFLRAMLIDDEQSNISDIARRMGVTGDYAQKYRKRLISSGIIEAPRRGYVSIAVPFLADYLRDSLD